MPTKIYLTGDCTGYNLSEYQKSAKPLLSKDRRGFSIDGNAQKLIVSSALRAAYIEPEKNFSLCFGTFTFDSNKFNPYYNDSISDFFKDLKRNHLCTGFIWTKELTKKQTIHYHSIFEIRTYKGIAIELNDLWNKHRGYESKNGFRTDPDKGLILKDPIGAAVYASKYASKSMGIKYPTPVYSISDNWRTEPIVLDTERKPEIVEYLNKNIVPLHRNTQNTHYYTEYTDSFKINRESARILFDSY
jgi:hypothetical protein